MVMGRLTLIVKHLLLLGPKEALMTEATRMGNRIKMNSVGLLLNGNTRMNQGTYIENAAAGQDGVSVIASALWFGGADCCVSFS